MSISIRPHIRAINHSNKHIQINIIFIYISKIRRDCSCRGSSSGYAHISCIVTMSQKKSRAWDGEVFYEYIKWWTECQICYQDFRNGLAVDLASEFVSFVDQIRQNFLREQKHQAHIEALHIQHTALLDKNDEATDEQTEEARVIANKLISIVRYMECKFTKISDSVYAFEADAYSCLGNISLRKGTVESGKEALGYFEKCKDIWVRLKHDFALTIIENNIVLAKAECGEVNETNKEEAVESFLKEYNGYVKTFGPYDLGTLHSGIHLFLALENANRRRQAANFIAKLAARSKQVHGKDHGMTRKIESYYLPEPSQKAKGDIDDAKKPLTTTRACAA